MRHPTCPIALVTRLHVTAARWQEQFLRQSSDLDVIIDKDEIITAPDAVRATIISLSKGFKDLEKSEGANWESVLGLMGANEEEKHVLREAGPPVTNGEWNAPQTAKWIRAIVLAYPGIVYDELTAATRLGITLESFRRSGLQDLLEPARYTGLFGDNRTVWWRGRLFEIAQRLMLSENVKGTTSEHFREAYESSVNERLDPAICIYDGKATADWVCHILREPVKQAHSVPYYPDSRPSVMDKARVSFTAIKSSNAFDEALVDADSYDLVKSLWE